MSLFFLITSCGKPKIVHICGDHVCVNREEAKQYFEDNLSLEVKLVENNKNKNKNLDLVELNLTSSSNEKRQISLTKKTKKNKIIRSLSQKEIKDVKSNLKKRKNTKKIEKKNKEQKDKKISKKEVKSVNKSNILIADICNLLEKCSIDEISKYLIKVGKNKDFPDITARE